MFGGIKLKRLNPEGTDCIRRFGKQKCGGKLTDVRDGNYAFRASENVCVDSPLRCTSNRALNHFRDETRHFSLGYEPALGRATLVVEVEKRTINKGDDGFQGSFFRAAVGVGRGSKQAKCECNSGVKNMCQ